VCVCVCARGTDEEIRNTYKIFVCNVGGRRLIVRRSNIKLNLKETVWGGCVWTGCTWLGADCCGALF
jgi:hypothetical protein